MARIDLINVGKTLTERDGVAPGPIVPATRPHPGPAPGGARTGSAFSIQDLNLRIPDGKTLVILGPSGCGKTTLLRIHRWSDFAGFGRSAIRHPSQIVLANAVFRPSDAEIAAALRVGEAARSAETHGLRR